MAHVREPSSQLGQHPLSCAGWRRRQTHHPEHGDDRDDGSPGGRLPRNPPKQDGRCQEGGDPAALRPTNEMMSYLQIARSVLSGEKEVWEFGGKAKDKLPLVASVLKSFDKKAAAKIEDALSLPLSPQELE